MKSGRTLSLEVLEDRATPATWGNPWPDASHLTVSFVPDGTDVGGQASRLFQALDAIAPRAVWQGEMLRAMQAWASQIGMNIGVVADDGSPLGTPGRPQSDPRFGDVRISGGTYNGVLAFSSPFDATSGTWSGDVRVNLAAHPSITGDTGPDLYTVFLQEFGHVLGLDNSLDQSSVMYEWYDGPRAGPSAGDVTNAQALYGARPLDVFEGRSGNSTFGTAADLGLFQNSGGVLALDADGDLTAAADVDVYRFNAPSLLGSFRATLQRQGLSLVTPRMTLYDDSGRVIDTAVSTDPFGGDLVIDVSRLAPLATYYLKVESAGATYGVGGYHLRLESLAIVNNLLGALTSTVQTVGQLLTNNDLHTNDSIATATNLFGGLFGASDTRFDVAFQGSISDSGDKDYYRLTAPTDGSNVMQVMAWGRGTSQVLPAVKVFDAEGNAVPAQVLLSEGGAVVVQVAGLTAGATYYVDVESAKTGNYFLGVDFRTRAIQLQKFADSTVSAAKQTEQGTLEVSRSGLFHFVLGAQPNDGTGVRMTILDASGRVVRSMNADSGQAVSMTLTLGPGTYTVRFDAYRTDGKPITAVRYVLWGILMSDPIGPQAEDPTGDPSSSPPPPDSSTSGSSTTTTNNSSTDYYGWYGWYPPPDSSGTTTSGGPQPEDPYGSGYTT